MIREDDLHEAIAECLGKREPDSNTCIKLAAYYTILDHIKETPAPQYSFANETPTNVIRYDGQSKFAEKINGKSIDDVLSVMDELMDTICVIYPRLYDGVMRKL